MRFKGHLCFILVGLFAAHLVAADMKSRSFPFVAHFYTREPIKERGFKINIADLYSGASYPFKETPFYQALVRNEKDNSSESEVWTKNRSLLINKVKEIGIDSDIKTGSRVFLFSREYGSVEAKCKSIQIFYNLDNPSFSSLILKLEGKADFPPHGRLYGVILESPLPSQDWKVEKLPEDIIKVLYKFGITKFKGSLDRGSLIHTSVGDFVFTQHHRPEEFGGFDVRIFYRASLKDAWKLHGKFNDQSTDVFGDLDGDGVPEIGSVTGYKSFAIRKIYPDIKVILTGTSGV